MKTSDQFRDGDRSRILKFKIEHTPRKQAYKREGHWSTIVEIKTRGIKFYKE